MDWGKNQPAYSNTQNSIGLWKSGGWKWADWTRPSELGYICEKQIVSQ